MQWESKQFILTKIQNDPWFQERSDVRRSILSLEYNHNDPYAAADGLQSTKNVGCNFRQLHWHIKNKKRRRNKTMKFFYCTAKCRWYSVRQMIWGLSVALQQTPPWSQKKAEILMRWSKRSASIVDGPISGEVKATTVDAEGMIKEGREIAKIQSEYGC